MKMTTVCEYKNRKKLILEQLAILLMGFYSWNSRNKFPQTFPIFQFPNPGKNTSKLGTLDIKFDILKQ